jgi:hypothetical protein
MIPEHLKAEYWKQVRESLHRKFGMSLPQATAAVELFQDDALAKTGEMVFHAEAEATAKTVKSWLESLTIQSAARSA